LSTAYIFVYRWGWLFFRETFHGQQELFLFGYLIFGALVILLSVIAMLRSIDPFLSHHSRP
jgi:multisubunit Na+/H+ antiporter MnhB subunit